MQYLTALTPLIAAIAESESSAVQGVTEPPDSLTSAVGKVSAADASLGDDLKTHERWTGLKDKIAKLPKTPGGPNALLSAHVEVADLTLALFQAVRRNSQLSRDPDSDISNLQQAVAVDMPVTVSLVGREGDYANLLQNPGNAKIRAQLAIQFGQSVLDVQDAVTALTEDLQAAVDDTKSSTLSGNLVATLDSFRRGVESMNRGANPGGSPNVATMSTAQNALQTSLNALSGVTLREMTGLLDDRSDSLAYKRAEALVMGLLAVLLAIAALIWPLIGRRREEPTPAPTTGPGESTRDVANRMSGPGAGPGTGPYGGGPYDIQPAYGEFDPTRRERSGAIR